MFFPHARLFPEAMLSRTTTSSGESTGAKTAFSMLKSRLGLAVIEHQGQLFERTLREGLAGSARGEALGQSALPVRKRQHVGCIHNKQLKCGQAELLALGGWRTTPRFEGSRRPRGLSDLV